MIDTNRTGGEFSELFSRPKIPIIPCGIDSTEPKNSVSGRTQQNAKDPSYAFPIFERSALLMAPQPRYNAPSPEPPDESPDEFINVPYCFLNHRGEIRVLRDCTHRMLKRAIHALESVWGPAVVRLRDVYMHVNGKWVNPATPVTEGLTYTIDLRLRGGMRREDSQDLDGKYDSEAEDDGGMGEQKAPPDQPPPRFAPLPPLGSFDPTSNRFVLPPAPLPDPKPRNRVQPPVGKAVPPSAPPALELVDLNAPPPPFDPAQKNRALLPVRPTPAPSAPPAPPDIVDLFEGHPVPDGTRVVRPPPPAGTVRRPAPPVRGPLSAARKGMWDNTSPTAAQHAADDVAARIATSRLLLRRLHGLRDAKERKKLVRRIVANLLDTGECLCKKDGVYAIRPENQVAACMVIRGFVQTPEQPALPPLAPELRAASEYAVPVPRPRRRIPVRRRRPAAPIELALLDHAQEEWERDHLQPVPVPPAAAPPVGHGETTDLDAKTCDTGPNEWYLSDAGGIVTRFHGPTVSMIAEVALGARFLNLPPDRVDIEMERVARGRCKAVFEHVKRPRAEHGYDLNLESMRMYEVGGRNEAMALYAAEAVMWAHRSWALQLKGTQPSRAFVAPDKLGAHRSDARKEYEAYQHKYGKSLPFCRALSAKLHNAWQHVRHPMNPSKRHFRLTVELPRALRREAEMHLFQHDGGVPHPFDTMGPLMNKVAPDFMIHVNQCVRHHTPAMPTYQNFH